VHRAFCHSNLQEVSLKLEPVCERSQLLNEAYILTKLAGLPGVPTLLSHGTTLDGSKYYSTTDVIGIFYFYFYFMQQTLEITNLHEGSSLNKHKWTKEDGELLWRAAVEVVKGIHSRGAAIIDLKPEHLILSPRGLFIVDYGCSYFVAKGRPIAFMLMSPIFSSVRDSNSYCQPGTQY
jgi:serine/threonine protein kinase